MMKNVEGEMMKSEEQQVENEVGGKTEEANNRSVVLKLDLHCEGCVRRIIKAVRSFKGKIHHYSFHFFLEILPSFHLIFVSMLLCFHP